MLTRPKTAAAAVVFSAAILVGGVALAAPQYGPPSSSQARPWPSYWSSVCGTLRPGFDSCHAIELMSPSKYWSAGPRAHRTAQWSPVGHGPDQTPAPPSSGYYPADLQSAYGLGSAAADMSPGTGAPTVAIVDAYDDPDAASNLSAYRAAMTGATSPSTGLVNAAIPPLCGSSGANGCVTFTKVNQSGGTSYPRANSGWSEEISLDLDMVSAVCPDCNIVLVEASNSSTANLAAAVNEAKTFSPVVITNSYGGSESSSETAYNSAYSSSAKTAITVAAGDDGYGVEFPAASPTVTAVGGTSLDFTGTASSPSWSQTVWSGSGSGCSADEPMPSWQEVAAYSTSICRGRQVADVSAVADPNTGVAAYDTYGESGWLVFGGTSVSTQIIGAIYAVASTAGTFEPSSQYLYVDSAGSSGPTPGLVPVTSGSNGTCGNLYLCNAADSLASGYNGPAGLGYPYGVTAFTASNGGGGGTTSTSTSTTSTTSTSTTSTSTTTTSTTTTSTTTTPTTAPTMTVAVTAGTTSRSGRDYVVPITVAASNSSSGTGIGGASALLDVYEGASCSGSVAASGTFTTGTNGQVSVTFESLTAATWCLEATVTASGYSQASGETTFST
jgi:subtilase family serine protease